ncbi:MAG: hypothetical protein IJY80_04275, partial [Opitutales bacterium]|nr:hypothetical protein [Opitutales bacterium]
DALNFALKKRTPVASVGRTKFFEPRNCFFVYPQILRILSWRTGISPVHFLFFAGNPKASEMLHIDNPMRSEQRKQSLGTGSPQNAPREKGFRKPFLRSEMQIPVTSNLSSLIGTSISRGSLKL